MESGTISLTGAANAVKTARALESDKPGLKSQFYTDQLPDLGKGT